MAGVGACLAGIRAGASVKASDGACRTGIRAGLGLNPYYNPINVSFSLEEELRRQGHEQLVLLSSLLVVLLLDLKK